MRQSKLLDPNSLLPSPDSKAHSRSEKLSVYIKKMIDRHGGSIGFDEYMDLALYQKDLGYYSSGNKLLFSKTKNISFAITPVPAPISKMQGSSKSPNICTH